MVSDDKAQDCVAEQLETLVGRPAAPLGTVRPVRQRLMQQVTLDGVLAKRSAQLPALWLRLARGIAQAASTFALT
ncbi:MAG: hypothetical protein ACLP1E_04590 [Acidimicrobiales bacterium]